MRRRRISKLNGKLDTEEGKVSDMDAKIVLVVDEPPHIPPSYPSPPQSLH